MDKKVINTAVLICNNHRKYPVIHTNFVTFQLMTMLTSYTGMEAGTSQIHISQLADFRISGVFLTP